MKLSTLIDLLGSGKCIYIGSVTGWLLACHDKSEFETLYPQVDNIIIGRYQKAYDDYMYKSEHWEEIVECWNAKAERKKTLKADALQTKNDLLEDNRQIRLNDEIPKDIQKAKIAENRAKIKELQASINKLLQNIRNYERNTANIIAAAPSYLKRAENYKKLIQNYISLANREVIEYYDKSYCFDRYIDGVGIIVEGKEKFGTLNGLLSDERMGY